jgi:hypothetical protein
MALNSSSRTVTAYFSSRDKAQIAVHALKDAGFTSSQISLAIRPEYGADETNASRNGNEEGMWDKIKDFSVPTPMRMARRRAAKIPARRFSQ